MKIWLLKFKERNHKEEDLNNLLVCAISKQSNLSMVWIYWNLDFHDMEFKILSFQQDAIDSKFLDFIFLTFLIYYFKISSNCTYFRHFSFIEKQFAIITLALNEGLETYHNLCYHQEKIKYLDIKSIKYV